MILAGIGIIDSITGATGPVASDSIRAALSATGQSAYDAATTGNFFAVSQADYTAVLAAVSGATTYQWTEAQMTGGNSGTWGAPFLFVDPRTPTAPSGTYVIGFSFKPSSATSYTVGVYAGTGNTGSPTYSIIGNTQSFVATSAGTAVRYMWIRKAPATSFTIDNYIGLYSTQSPACPALSDPVVGIKYRSSATSGAFNTWGGNVRFPAFNCIVTTTKTW